MQLLSRFFNFYLDASIHVALAVVSLYEVSAIILKSSTNWFLLGFLFFGTIVCYNFIKYGVEAKKYLIVSNPYHKAIQVFSFFAFGFAVYFFFQLSKEIWLTIMILMGVSVLYAIPLLPKAKNLRSLGGAKTFLVALVWMGTTVLLPTIDNQLEVNWDIGVLLTQRFLLVLILLLPFEIRDMDYDKPELRTLPQRVGVKKTKMLGYILTLGYFLICFLKDEFNTTEVFCKLLVSTLLLIVLILTRKKQHIYFSSFWVELIPMLFLGMFYFMNWIV